MCFGAAAALGVLVAAALLGLDRGESHHAQQPVPTTSLKYSAVPLSSSRFVVRPSPSPHWLTPELCATVQTLRDAQDEAERRGGFYREGRRWGSKPVPAGFPVLEELTIQQCRVALPKDANEIVSVPGGWLASIDCGEFGEALYAVDPAGHARAILDRALLNIQPSGRDDEFLAASPVVVHLGLPVCGSVWRIGVEGRVSNARAEVAAVLPIPALRLHVLKDGNALVLGRERPPRPVFYFDRTGAAVWEVICEENIAVKMHVVPSSRPGYYDGCEGSLRATVSGRKRSFREACTVAFTRDVGFCARGVGSQSEKATIDVLVGADDVILKAALAEGPDAPGLGECLVRRLPGVDMTGCGLAPGTHTIGFEVERKAKAFADFKGALAESGDGIAQVAVLVSTLQPGKASAHEAKLPEMRKVFCEAKRRYVASHSDEVFLAMAAGHCEDDPPLALDRAGRLIDTSKFCSAAFKTPCP